MKLTTMAWRNLWRRKRRTAITAFSIAFGVLLAVTFTGSGDYVYTNMINTGAQMGLGHISVEPNGYNQTPGLDKRIHQTTALRQQLIMMPGVSDAIVRIMGQAMFASARKSVGGAFIAVDPAQESSVNNLFIRSIIAGSRFTDSNGQGIVIGSRMAQKLGVTIGKKLVYTTTDVNGEIVSEIARVSAIFQTGVTEVDGAMALLPLDRVRGTLRYQADDATLVAITIKDHRATDAMTAGIAAQVALPEREVLSWRQTQPDLAGLIAMDRSSNYVTQTLIGLLIAAGILNTLLMSVLERTREFGVMMAIGMSPHTLFRLVITESLWLAIIGLVFGIVITAPWYHYLNTIGIDFSGAMGDDYSAGGVLIDPVMKVYLYRESVIAILAGVFGLTLVAGIYPAWRAGRIPPVASLKTL